MHSLATSHTLGPAATARHPPSHHPERARHLPCKGLFVLQTIPILRMPEGEASHPRPGNPCGVCMEVNDEDGNPLRGHDLGCGGTEQLHWFCSPCSANFWSSPLCRQPHRLCTAPPPRETQDEDLTLQTLRTLTARGRTARKSSGWTSSPTRTRRHHPPAPAGAHQPGRCQIRGRTPRFTSPTTNTTTPRHGAVYPPLAICQTVGAPSPPRTSTTTAPSSSPSPPASRSPSAGWWGTQNGRWASPAAPMAPSGGIPSTAAGP